MYKIINITWERVNVHIVFNKEIKDDIYLISNDKKILLNKINNKVIINITNTPEGTMLDAAEWNLYIENKKITIDPELLKTLDDKSRNFIYGRKKYAYIINFSVDEELNIKIMTKFMIINNKPQKFYRLQETTSIINKAKIIIKRLIVLLCNIYYRILRIFKFSQKNILFLTENSQKLTSNLKYLYDYLPKNKYKIRIYANDKYKTKKSILKIVQEISKIAMSDIIFVDNYTSVLTHLKLSKKVKLVQLWHAGIGFKSVGYARFGLEGSPHPYQSCHRNYTNAIVDQDNLIDIYSEVFGVKKSIFRSYGIPRLDNYLNENKIKTATEKLYLLNPKIKTSKVILFSPTYRGTGSNTAYYDYSLFDLEKIYDFCTKNDFIFIIKMHPFITKKIEIKDKYKDRIYEYSNIDINDLIYISDIMITDYSSCAYEFSLFERPLIFYRFDKELYEYQRPIHTVDSFTKKQFEVKNFDEVLKILEKNKNININERFTNMKKRNEKSSCEKILNDVIGE